MSEEDKQHSHETDEFEDAVEDKVSDVGTIETGEPSAVIEDAEPIKQVEAKEQGEPIEVQNEEPKEVNVEESKVNSEEVKEEEEVKFDPKEEAISKAEVKQEPIEDEPVEVTAGSKEVASDAIDTSKEEKTVNDTLESIEPPLSKSTEHFDEDSEALQEEHKKLDEKLHELTLADEEIEKKSASSAAPPPIPQRSANPDELDSANVAPVVLPVPLPERPEGSSARILPPIPDRAPSVQSVGSSFVAGPPPALPDRHHAGPPPIPNRGPVPPLPGRDSAAPPLPSRHDHEEGLKPFKNKAISDVFVPPPLPPQLSEAQRQLHRPGAAAAATGLGGIGSWFHRSSVSKSTTDLSEKSLEYEENYDLLLNRLTENNEEYLSQREQLDSSHNELLSSFNEIVSELDTSVSVVDETTTSTDDANDSELNKTDWPFWTKVFNNYASVAKAEPAKLSKEISKGIPDQIRNIVWQLVSNSNSQQFEQQFNELKLQESPNEKSIQKDLTRTSFIADHNIDVDSLHNVIKVYSLIDTEVGYTQGMAFIVAPLLLNSTELEAFALFHKLMYGYNLRSLYLPEMPGLLLTLYQFDRLVEDTLPNLHTHFTRQGVRSSMYATQWFLTFFAYKFPLEFVLRIFDIVITEGFESILKFAIALVAKNEEKLLTLKFDKLVEYLKEYLFTAYLIEPEIETQDDEDNNQQTLKSNLGDFFKFNQPPKPITVDTYDVNQFIEDATNVKLLPITLRRYEEEFEQIHQQEKERREEVDELKSKNNQLRREIKKVESSYTILNREHVQLANEIISNRIKVETLEDQIKDLNSQNHTLRERILSIQKQEVEVPANFESDLKNAMERNLEVMTQNQELEDQVGSLLQEVEELKAQLTREKALNIATQSEEPAPQHGPKGWSKKFFK